MPAMAGASADKAKQSGSLVEAEAIPPEVAELAAVWRRPADAVWAGIVAMVRGSGERGCVRAGQPDSAGGPWR